MAKTLNDKLPEIPVSEPEKEVTNTMKWKEIRDPVGCSPRARHGHRCVNYGQYLIVIGGGNEGIMADINIFNTENNKWFSPAAISSVFLGCAAGGAVIIEYEIYVFGGILEYGDYSNQIYKISLCDWSIVLCEASCHDGTEVPVPRLGHSFSLASEKRIFMFGGLTNNSTIFVSSPKYLNDLYILKISETDDKLTWIKPEVIGTPPSPRESHSALIYNYKNRETLVIYGGMCGKRLGDIHLLDIETLIWSQPIILGEPPPPRSLHVAGICQNKMIIFGGWIPSRENNRQNSDKVYAENDWECTSNVSVLNIDTLTWELSFNSENSENAPKARAGHCGCVINNRLYIWSGRDGFRKSWNDQVCCKDLWFLEILKPEPPAKLMMDGNDTISVNIKWDPILNADYYLVQIMKVGANTVCNSKDVKNIIERNAKNTLKELLPPHPPSSPVVLNNPSLPALKLVTPPPGLKIDILKNHLLADVKNTNYPITNNDLINNPAISSITEPNKIASDHNFPLDNFGQTELKNMEIFPIIQNDQKIVKNNLITSSPFPQKILNKNETLNSRGIPPLGVSLTPINPSQKVKDVPTTQPILNNAPKSVVFADIPTGKWFESIIISDTKVCVTQFYVDLSNDNSVINKTSTNRRCIQLESNYTYRVRIASVNSCGIGNFSSPLTFSTTAPGLPGPPTNVKIFKNSTETYMSWQPVNNNDNLDYFVYISRPISMNSDAPEKIRDLKYLYDKIYQGKETTCSLSIDSADEFELGSSDKPYLMLRIVAKNSRGYGPVTQIKWLKNEFKTKGEHLWHYDQHPIPLKRLKNR